MIILYDYYYYLMMIFLSVLINQNIIIHIAFGEGFADLDCNEYDTNESHYRNKWKKLRTTDDVCKLSKRKIKNDY